MKLAWCLAMIVAWVRPSGATPLDEDPAVRALKDELARTMDKLELPSSAKPYYVGFTMYELKRATVTASWGALVSSSLAPQRTVDIDLRVGDRSFDNSNVASGDRMRSVTLSADDDYDSIRHALWLAFDRDYKRATETLERKRAVAKAETKDADAAEAFSTEAPSHIVAERAQPALDEGKLDALATKLSAVFRNNPDVYDADVAIHAATGRQIFVSSEGSQSVETVGFVRIIVTCSTQADDGMPVHDSRTFLARTGDELPPEAELVAEVEALSKELSAIRKAPIVDDYSGPVLFTGQSAAQVIRVLLSENFSGTPAPKADRPGAHSSGNSELVGKVGQRILPAGTQVIDDPSVEKVGKQTVAGATKFDEEGMPAQKVSLVEDGTFKRFLMSRIPRKGFEHTNGHAASSPFSSLRAHPMSLFVSSKKGVGNAELKKRAVAAAKDQGLKYVIVVESFDMWGGADDLDPSMFSGDSAMPKPTVMKRVYVDGKEELVRGGALGALPMRSLKDVIGIGSQPTVYNYVASGISARYAAFIEGSDGYFASIVAPSLLFRDLDVKKPQGAQRTPPIAPRPQ